MHLLHSLLLLSALSCVNAGSYIYPMTPVQADECVNGTMKLLQEGFLANPEIAEHCMCKARPTIVNVPWEDEFTIVEPKYVAVLRCSGSCHSQVYEECRAVSVVQKPFKVRVEGMLDETTLSVESHEDGCTCSCPWTHESCSKRGGVLRNRCTCVRQDGRPGLMNADASTTILIVLVVLIVIYVVFRIVRNLRRDPKR